MIFYFLPFSCVPHFSPDHPAMVYMYLRSYAYIHTLFVCSFVDTLFLIAWRDLFPNASAYLKCVFSTSLPHLVGKLIFWNGFSVFKCQCSGGHDKRTTNLCVVRIYGTSGAAVRRCIKDIRGAGTSSKKKNNFYEVNRESWHSKDIKVNEYSCIRKLCAKWISRELTIVGFAVSQSNGLPELLRDVTNSTDLILSDSFPLSDLNRMVLPHNS